MRKRATTYKEAGVDIDAAAEAVRRITSMARKTFSPRVITDIGGFSGLYSLNVTKYDQPVLVSSVDGVGSKLKVAFMADKHDTIGLDLVAMGVNDILVQGAKPLFFLDYLAMPRVDPGLIEEIMKGIVAGCMEADCSLIGGETAELPDFYAPGEYDLAGFVVGVVDRDEIIDGSEIAVGDHLIGLGSTGLHSNGYTLVRRIIFDDLGLQLSDPLLDVTVAEELLRPTKIYANTITMLVRDFKILGMAHITGGGIIENLPRILPQACQAVIHKDSWKHPEIFNFIQTAGQVEENEMFRTFNMGLGMIIAVQAEQSEEILDRLHGMNEPAYLIGEIREHRGSEPPLVLA
ncbi:MAG: phosphoribosylformylglycinamidine cyclo-ligase [Pseudomonadota bacterium]